MKSNIRYSVIVNLIRTLVITLLSFISFPYVCRILGDESLGTYTWANTFIYYFLILAKAGIPNVAIRECAKVKNDKKALSLKAQEFFIIQIILTIFSFALMCSIVFSVKQLLEWKELVFILSLNFIVGAFSFEWIFIALEKHYYISLRSIITLSLGAILTLSFIKSSNDIYIYAIIAILSTIITSIVNVFCLHKYISFSYCGKYNFKQYLVPISNVFIISLMLTLYNSSDTFILGFLDPSKSQVANYSVGIKTIEIIITLITSLDAVFIPRASRYYKLENKSFFNNLTRYGFNICFFISIPAIATMSTLSTQITNILSGNSVQYADAPWTLIILVSMTLTFSLSDMIYEQVLLPMKKERYYLYTLLIGAILNIGGSIGLGLVFKDHPSIGVAIATMATDLLVLIIMILFAKKHVIHAIFNKNTLKLFVSGVLVALFSLVFVHFVHLNDALEIIVVVLIGGVIYLTSLALMKENLVMSFIRKREEKTNE